ncbi:CAP domain-containing protein [Patescibacteria group bacterium]|nr:CAP domain-containing protein [Patescibacteria group bacterium]
MGKRWKQIWYTKIMVWRNLFLPHKDTHKKAHLISWEGLVCYILIFIFLQVSFSIIGYTKPGILGISADIDQKKLIELTNSERQKMGLPPVSENEALDRAAVLKAQNMLAENYWAHFAPSGKTPWDFILGSGYKFTYAGENLAKNFYNSDDVVSAWMNSKTHKDNLLNPKYKDIGIAVIEGNLNGQKTTLVVQMFGTTEMTDAKPAIEISGKQIAVPPEDLISKQAGSSGVLVARVLPIGVGAKSVFDPFMVYKWGGISIIVLIGLLLAADVWVLKKRGILRLSSHHIAHMALLSLTAGSLLTSSPGAIL